MLRLRILTALVMVAAIVGAVFWLDTKWLGVALGAVILVGAWEWGSLSGLRNRGAGIAYLATMAALALLAVNYLPEVVWFAIGCLWWALVTVRVLRGRAPAPLRARVSYAWLAAGPMTLLPAYSAILYLHRSDMSGAVFLLYAMSIVWVADIGAYFTGRRWGRRKLAPAISPGKTREGAVGALLLVAVYGVAGGWWFTSSLAAGAVLVVVVVVAGSVSIVGDLFESLLKRAAQRKDSGRLLPGHGGVLDRIDSLTAAMPVFAFGTALAAA